MICNSQKCQNKSPHDWGDEGCERPTYRCRICGEYFNELKTAKTGEHAPYDEAEVCPVGECGSEDYDTMHKGFESGDEVVVLDRMEWWKGLYHSKGYCKISWVSDCGPRYAHPDKNIFNTTKSGWLKLCERLESQRAAIDDSLKSADDEIKKIEEEEKK